VSTVGKIFSAWIGVCAGLCSSLAHAQEGSAASFTAPHGFAIFNTRSYLGLNLGRGLTADCPATQLLCESHDRSAQIHAGRMFGAHWGAEVGYVDTGRLLRAAGEAHAQGLNMALVGRARLSSLGVYGKVGTAYGRPDTSVMGNGAAGGPDQGFGLTWGGGVSWDFSPRLSATFEWVSYDLRLPGGPVRATSLGLQYRY
jgi:opacity protein-like surface antigen